MSDAEHQEILNKGWKNWNCFLPSWLGFRNLLYFLTTRFGLYTCLFMFAILLATSNIWIAKKTEIISDAIRGRNKTEMSKVSKGSMINQQKQTSVPGAFGISIDNPLLGGMFFMDGMLCSGIEKLAGNVSIVDFGGGLGQYGRCLMRSYDNMISGNSTGKKLFETKFYKTMKRANLYNTSKIISSYVCYDGSSNVEQVTNNFVKQLNLAVPFDLGKKFDWVLSLEVGEHIPKEFEAVYMNNLLKHYREGIILSWAVKGQPGYQHINTQDNGYIISKMTERGLTHDLKSQEFLRKMASYGYFRNTVMVFRGNKTT